MCVFFFVVFSFFFFHYCYCFCLFVCFCLYIVFCLFDWLFLLVYMLLGFLFVCFFVVVVVLFFVYGVQIHLAELRSAHKLNNLTSIIHSHTSFYPIHFWNVWLCTATLCVQCVIMSCRKKQVLDPPNQSTLTLLHTGKNAIVRCIN